jgi:hypothetical protein
MEKPPHPELNLQSPFYSKMYVSCSKGLSTEELHWNMDAGSNGIYKILSTNGVWSVEILSETGEKSKVTNVLKKHLTETII